ncbi:MAG: acyl--CoA ligase [Alphaproteobacteria bacterium]|nr:acyl--CoA ligase [Alphaproteobacteria bacterium]
METYEKAFADFEWELPATFNFGADVVDARAARNDKTALIWCDATGDRRRFTFSEIASLSNRFAALLADQGIEKGDRVVIMLPRIPMWHIALVGCLKLGAVPIPCVEMLTAKDLAYRIDHSGARGVITTAANTAKFEGMSVSVQMAVGQASGWVEIEDALSTTSDRLTPTEVGIDDPAIMFYTSGSAGEPKGVLHASRALFAWRVSAWYWNDLYEDDTMWCTADTGWSKAGTSILFGPWSCGATVFFYNGPFDDRGRFELIEKYGVTVFCAAATELRRLIQTDTTGIDLSSLRLTISAGESVNPEIVTRWREVAGTPLLDGYGQTETLMTVVNYNTMPVKSGSMGRPLPGTRILIVDEQDQPVSTEAPGQLAVGLPSPQFMLGYWRDPELTQQAIVEIGGDRFFLTGDTVSMDKDGYLYYHGRSDDVINSAGYRIGPLEVENALMEHRAVQECAAVASPHPERGEVVKAFIVVAVGHTPSDALIEELQDHTKRVTAPYKYPRRIEFVDDLPKTATGKIKRRRLRDLEFGRGPH